MTACPRPGPRTSFSNSMSLDLSLAETPGEVCIGTGAAGEQSFALAAGTAVEMRQRYESEATAGDRTLERLPGWARLGKTLVAVRDFWQLYPAAIRFSRAERDSLVRVGLMPSIDASDYPSAPNSIEDWVWGYLRGGRYRVRRGEGRTHELFLTFGVPADGGSPTRSGATRRAAAGPGRAGVVCPDAGRGGFPAARPAFRRLR